MPDPSFNSFGDNQRLGGFEILEKIGEGGMGAVYRAKQLSLDRIVALKVLSPKLAADPKYTDSFLREALSAARLQHANIVAVFDAGKADEYYYYAMEFIHGESLQKWVARDGALPEPLALDVTLCVADALRHAWNTEQLIHRDIKPDNILIDTHGNVKLCDLGLAKYFGETTLMSLSGQVFGTPQYMSPEQARAEKVDCRTDIYSLGLTLYYALTAQIPFHGGTHGMVMARHMTEQLPDPRDFAPSVSVHTVRIIEKMVSKNAAQRYDNWDEVLRDLRLAKEGKPPQIPLIFHGISSVKRNGVLPMEGRAPSRPQPAEVVTWEKPAPQPRVKQPAPQNGGAGVPPVDQNVVGTDRWAVRNSEIGAPSGRALPTKSRAPLYIASGIGLLLLAVIIVLAVPHLKPKTQNPSVPPSANPPTTVVNPPPVNPVQAAAQLLAAAQQYAAQNPADFNGQLARFQNVITQFPQTPAANEAAAALQQIRARHAAAIAEQERLRQQQEQARLDEEARLAEEKRQQEEQQRKLADAFTDFQTQLLTRLQQRRYADAEKLAQDKLADESLASFQTVITDWRDAAQRAGKFWSALPTETAKLENREFLPKDLGALLAQLTNEPPDKLQSEYQSKNWKIGLAKVAKDRLEFEKRVSVGVTGNVGNDDNLPFAKLTTESVLALVDMMGSSSLKADAAWFCFAEQKYSLALARVSAADREKMTRLERDSREIVKQQEIARLLKTAKENDFKDNRGKNFALPALAQLLALDPNHAEARKLYTKISAYYDANFTNTIGMEMVWLPAPAGYYVGKYEVTQAEYEKVMKNNPSNFKDPRKPVERVSWNDAMEFCKRLTEIERAAGRLKEGWVYTLPTEKQWEYFVGNADLKDAVTSQGRSRSSTERVGSLGGNNFGLHDVRGNVWEWCADWYDSSQIFRVLRGASWRGSLPASLAVSARGSHPPVVRNDDLGFRVVLVAVGAASSSVEPAQTGQQTTVKPDSSAKAPSADKPWENSLGMKFVPVQGTNALFSIWETRVQDYEAFAKATGRQWEKPNFNQEPTHPAVNVSWDDAKAFCQWLTDKERREGRLTAQQEYRLPTEKEWNVAVGTTKYPWGDEWPPPKGAGNYADSLKVDDFPNTSPVGSFKANKFGLFDMGGNVWEWSEDLSSPSGSSRVLRGAAWTMNVPSFLLSSFRLNLDPADRRNFIGFRCVLVAR